MDGISPTYRSELSGIHPIDVISKKAGSDQKRYCLEMLASTEILPPIIVVWLIDEKGEQIKREDRIAITKILDHFKETKGKTQRFRRFDGTVPPAEFPFTIIQARERPPMAVLVADEGWEFRSCQH